MVSTNTRNLSSILELSDLMLAEANHAEIVEKIMDTAADMCDADGWFFYIRRSQWTLPSLRSRSGNTTVPVQSDASLLPSLRRHPCSAGEAENTALAAQKQQQHPCYCLSEKSRH